jgi:hypothetical protein
LYRLFYLLFFVLATMVLQTFHGAKTQAARPAKNYRVPQEMPALVALEHILAHLLQKQPNLTAKKTPKTRLQEF